MNRVSLLLFYMLLLVSPASAQQAQMGKLSPWLRQIVRKVAPSNLPQRREAAPLNPPNWGEVAAPDSAAEVTSKASPSWRRLEGAGGGWVELTLTALSSYAIGAATAYSQKQIVAERRPDKSDRRSFPSGHAMFAFAGATMLHHEFGNLSPWVTIGGYGIATLTAVDRLVRDRHYLHDVCAGAAIGIAATELTYFLKQKLFKSRNVDLSFTGQRLDLAIRW